MIILLFINICSGVHVEICVKLMKIYLTGQHLDVKIISDFI